MALSFVGAENPNNSPSILPRSAFCPSPNLLLSISAEFGEAPLLDLRMPFYTFLHLLKEAGIGGLLFALTVSRGISGG